MGAILRRAKRWLLLGHRWLGIATCVLFAVWFVSGIVMMYVAFPRLTDDERRAMLSPIEAEAVALSPAEAMEAAGVAAWPRSLRLEMLGDEPVYRIEAGGGRSTVSARDGRGIEGFDAAAALGIARNLPGAGDVRLIETLHRDQWTVTARFDPLRPLHRIALGDGRGTEIYISSRTGELALDTDRRERFWNWFGAIPHWIYFTELRRDGPLWRQVVLWLAGVGMVVAATGIWIGLLRARLRNRLGRPVSPYRGWMLWHHVAGLAGGILVFTWVFSGWLSLDPGRMFGPRSIDRAAEARYAGHDGARFDLAAADLRAALDDGVVEAVFDWAAGRPVLRLADRDGPTGQFDGVDGRPTAFTEEEITDAAARLMPGVPVAFVERLEREDLYWYSHHRTRVLPVLRVGFADAGETWVHLDPSTGEMLGHSDRGRRLRRWLYNGLHSFDLPVLLRNRPLWDVVVWSLSLIGLVVSVSGVVIGWRRLVRPRPDSRRAARQSGGRQNAS